MNTTYRKQVEINLVCKQARKEWLGGVEHKTTVQCGRFVTNDDDNDDDDDNNNKLGGGGDDNNIACRILGPVTGPTNSLEVL